MNKVHVSVQHIFDPVPCVKIIAVQLLVKIFT